MRDVFKEKYFVTKNKTNHQKCDLLLSLRIKVCKYAKMLISIFITKTDG